MSFLLKAEEDWKIFGNVDPYFGVLANDRYKAEKIDKAALDEFFTSGVAHIDKVMTTLSNMFGTVPQGTALDFGCGVGRLTNALSSHFETVVGLDIAPGMLERARADSATRGVRNVTYANSLDAARMRADTYDFVHTYIVLQHIPTKIGEGIIRDMLNATKSGGMGAIHFTYGHAGQPLLADIKNMVKQTPVLRNLGNILLGRRRDTPAMQMNNYSLPRIVEIFTEAGIDQFNVVPVDDWGNLGAFVFFQKRTGRPSWSNSRPD